MPLRLAVTRLTALIALAAVVGLGPGVRTPAAHAGAQLTVGEVAEALACQCGCGLTVANCNHPNCKFAIPARRQIAEMIGQGKGRTEIIGFFRQRYGEKVLSAPTTEGFNLLAWTMPFAALALGGAFVLLMLARWQRAAPSLPAGPEAGAGRISAADPRLRERLDRQVRERL